VELACLADVRLLDVGLAALRFAVARTLRTLRTLRSLGPRRGAR
jgi:hypothetical protein